MLDTEQSIIPTDQRLLNRTPMKDWMGIAPYPGAVASVDFSPLGRERVKYNMSRYNKRVEA